MPMESDQRFRDKVVLVAGSNGGIGRAVAARFAREGARLACGGVTDEAARASAEHALDAGAPDVVALAADLGNGTACDRIIAETLEWGGAIDLSQVERSIKRDEWIVFLDWTPHWMNVTYDIKYREIANTCSDVLTVADPRMIEDHPEVGGFLRQ